ncbi:hypothetical protein H257_15694 [Aphanomyces astaci]|uniref:Uncharacterized protein n=1 Tax=Aphanomyces astaci TaxID=112090 RepID=W4FNW7_APHAT|nr:hypothetical protein H257_15694 [Aphanomyces astaci]ETV68378.1 hypothetical protein H257_15694 [Aphanomyces astaci]|eukprot:XP_009842173.1 hypothetical protein H257_15694 [Aphanomyces astaci]
MSIVTWRAHATSFPWTLVKSAQTIADMTLASSAPPDRTNCIPRSDMKRTALVGGRPYHGEAVGIETSASSYHCDGQEIPPMELVW